MHHPVLYIITLHCWHLGGPQDTAVYHPLQSLHSWHLRPFSRLGPCLHPWYPELSVEALLIGAESCTKLLIAQSVGWVPACTPGWLGGGLLGEGVAQVALRSDGRVSEMTPALAHLRIREGINTSWYAPNMLYHCAFGCGMHAQWDW
jgi:hypothetical protein